MRRPRSIIFRNAAIFAILLLLAPDAANVSAFAHEPAPAIVETVRIAVLGDDRNRLAGLVAREAPFEIVAVSQDPDLVWDPLSRNVTSASTVIAYDVPIERLPTVVDRTAVVRKLDQIANPWSRSIIRSDGANGPLHNGDGWRVVLTDEPGRNWLLIDIDGNGAVSLLYPGPHDDAAMKSSFEAIRLAAGPPFGTDVLVAITAAKPLTALEQRLEKTPALSAPELLKLVEDTLTTDVRLGLVSMTTAP